MKASRGFTLIELSIVITIIGLIIGSVVVGRNMIQLAERRATVKQLESFNSAVNTFRTKYNCLPGDCISATAFGWDVSSVGNGDATIGPYRDCAITDPCYFALRHEHGHFWYHLSVAKLIPDTISYTLVAASLAGVVTSPVDGITTRYIGLPGSPQSGGWVVHGGVRFENYPGTPPPFMPAHVLSLGVPRYYPLVSVHNGYAPADLYYIDTKIDDGLPFSGQAIAKGYAIYLDPPDYLTYLPSTGAGAGSIFGFTWGDSATPVCVRTDVTPFQYNIQYTGTDRDGNCGLAIKAAF